MQAGPARADGADAQHGQERQSKARWLQERLDLSRDELKKLPHVSGTFAYSVDKNLNRRSTSSASSGCRRKIRPRSSRCLPAWAAIEVADGSRSGWPPSARPRARGPGRPFTGTRGGRGSAADRRVDSIRQAAGAGEGKYLLITSPSDDRSKRVFAAGVADFVAGRAAQTGSLRGQNIATNARPLRRPALA